MSDLPACRVCGRPFAPSFGRGRPRLYCSPACRSEAVRTGLTGCQRPHLDAHHLNKVDRLTAEVVDLRRQVEDLTLALDGQRSFAGSLVRRIARHEAAASTGEKLCVRCNQVQGVQAFNTDPRRVDGQDAWCRSCRSRYNRDRYRYAKAAASLPPPSGPMPPV